MALQDLTPQLRTRLSRMERAVGWFVFLATALLVFGFVYYIYHTAERKGWFTPKFKYQTSLNNAAGLKVGDPVKLMGFTAGQITGIIPNEPDAWFGVTINFAILKPHYGYVWDDSKVKVGSDFLGNRFLEITKGVAGVATIDEGTNRAPQAMLAWKNIRAARKKIIADTHAAYPDLAGANAAKFDWLVMDELKRRVAADRPAFYTNLAETYWIAPEETPALNERLERVATQVEQALPNILNLTNKIAALLDNSARLTSNLNAAAVSLRPVVTSLASLTATADTNLPVTFGSINRSLENFAGVTSNLHAQVDANTNILTNISKSIVDTDDLVQSLKRHWLLRSAFKTPKTNASPPTR